MQRCLLFLCLVFAAPSVYEATGGLVELDEISFDKITSKFKASLVKFDVAYPYGEKHEAFTTFAKEAKDVDDLLVADVGVKDYGEKDNEGLAKKYGAHKDNFPAVRLFISGKAEPKMISFDESKGFTADALRKFVIENTGVYISLPGCVKELDKLAGKFMKASKEEKKNVVKEVEKIQKGLESKNEFSGKVYKTIMDKIIETGDDFINTEQQRLKKLLDGKISEEKKKQLQIRSNILQSFHYAAKKHSDEL
ncbi:protein windbeutel [Hyposmocoma kahamanoa]|uniref:protein windbeutel n=1 Tax=Hyposmocoma kahamanoa TaxID=1477025 RepID=UPI000E6D89BA|nr:protein windbeutel [Hyposmocoma kahamanoa]